MAKFDTPFIVEDAPELSSGFQLLANGEYSVICTGETEDVPTKSGTATVLEFTIQGGENDGYKYKTWLNFVNTSEGAVVMAWATLGNIAKAQGLATLKSTKEVLNKRMTVTVTTKPQKNDPTKYENKFVYSPYTGGQSATAPAASVATAAPAKKVNWGKQG